MSIAALALFAGATGARAAAAAVEQPAFAGDTVVSFDDVVAGTLLDTHYAGLGIADFNATVHGASGHSRVQPAAMYLLDGSISGTQVAADGASIEFTSTVGRVGAWLYKGNGQQYLSVLDASQNVLFTVAADATSQDSPFYDFVGIASDSNDIKFAVISNKNLWADPQWDIAGPTTFFDDFTFAPVTAVPEPGTYSMILASLVMMAFVVRRRTSRD